MKWERGRWGSAQKGRADIGFGGAVAYSEEKGSGLRIVDQVEGPRWCKPRPRPKGWHVPFLAELESRHDAVGDRFSGGFDQSKVAASMHTLWLSVLAVLTVCNIVMHN